MNLDLGCLKDILMLAFWALEKTATGSAESYIILSIYVYT